MKLLKRIVNIVVGMEPGEEKLMTEEEMKMYRNVHIIVVVLLGGAVVGLGLMAYGHYFCL
ncbi:MAG: hypothetical protein JRC60_00340 [Deltaproteobacteria bacterium]|nr:hypothetical protein [Deltaproteobacteria bacterium]